MLIAKSVGDTSRLNDLMQYIEQQPEPVSLFIK